MATARQSKVVLMGIVLFTEMFFKVSQNGHPQERFLFGFGQVVRQGFHYFPDPVSVLFHTGTLVKSHGFEGAVRSFHHQAFFYGLV